MRVNRRQQFVIAGYTLGSKTFDAVIFGYYEGGRLLYAGRTCTGFTPSSREHLSKLFRGLAIEPCPFANLPEATGRTLGRRTDGVEDQGVPVAATGTGGQGRVRGVDARWSFEARAVRRSFRG